MESYQVADLEKIPFGILILGKEGKVLPGGFNVAASKISGIADLGSLPVAEILFPEGKVTLSTAEQDALTALGTCVGDPLMLGEVFEDQLPKLGLCGPDALPQVVRFTFVDEAEIIERILVAFAPLPKDLVQAVGSSSGPTSLNPALLPQTVEEREVLEIFVRVLRCPDGIVQAVFREIDGYTLTLTQLSRSLRGGPVPAETLEGFRVAFHSARGSASQIGLDKVTEAAAQGLAVTKELLKNETRTETDQTRLAAEVLSFLKTWAQVAKIRRLLGAKP